MWYNPFKTHVFLVPGLRSIPNHVPLKYKCSVIVVLNVGTPTLHEEYDLFGFDLVRHKNWLTMLI